MHCKAEREKLCNGLKKTSIFIPEVISPLKTSPATEVKAKPRPYTASSSFPLLKVCFGGPHCGVVGHVVVSSEQLHLLPKQERVVNSKTHMHKQYITITFLQSSG